MDSECDKIFPSDVCIIFHPLLFFRNVSVPYDRTQTSEVRFAFRGPNYTSLYDRSSVILKSVVPLMLILNGIVFFHRMSIFFFALVGSE